MPYTKIIINPLSSESDSEWQEFLKDTQPYPDNLVFILPYNYNSILVTDDSTHEHINKYFCYAENCIQREYITVDDIDFQCTECLHEFGGFTYYDTNNDDEFVQSVVDDVREYITNNHCLDLDYLDDLYNLKYTYRTKYIKDLNKKLQEDQHDTDKKPNLLKHKPKFIFKGTTKTTSNV